MKNVLFAAVVFVAFASASSAQLDGNQYPKPTWTYDECKRFYDESLGVESFMWRARAIDSLAETHDPKGMAILRKRYAETRPGGHADGQGSESAWQMRYFIAGSLQHYLHSGGGAELRAAASNFKDDMDAWLWYHSIRAFANQDGPAATLQFIKDRGTNKFFRAAAIEALARNGAEEILPLISELLELKNLPKPGLELRLLTCASATALRSGTLKSKRDTPAYLAAARAVISILDIPEVDANTKLCLARELGALFESEGRERESAPWIRRLEKKEPQPVTSIVAAGDTAVTPAFMGIQARGHRIVYVLDFSDSMLVPLTPQDIEEFERGGHDTSVGAADLMKEPVIKLNWKSIRHRLDAARECLRMSLRELSEDKYFSIVVFGDVAENFKSTNGLVKATKANIKLAERELDSFDPSGTTVGEKKLLKGKTNMHGGLRMAFRLTDKGALTTDDEYVNAATFDKGADTIFLLTDGIPNWDDYPGKGPIEKDRGSGDPESGQREAAKGETTHYNYAGPYSDKTFYQRDMQRLNLFRKVEIHCIGIGEAHNGWLDATARIGNGKSRKVGKDSR
jgi:hypothetical protein